MTKNIFYALSFRYIAIWTTTPRKLDETRADKLINCTTYRKSKKKYNRTLPEVWRLGQRDPVLPPLHLWIWRPLSRAREDGGAAEFALKRLGQAGHEVGLLCNEEYIRKIISGFNWGEL